ncbi:MAG: FecR domain-containing protein, partial [Opitutae bacterium]|nr:FecR domain-containing protein [Opitutae bacterium]
MKTIITRLLILCAVTAVVFSPSAFAQRQLGKKKGPTSKLYIAENIGEARVKSGDRIYSVRQASAFDAPGTVIETSENSRTTFVYSNGVGMTVGSNTRVEINRFEQEAFSAKAAAGAGSAEEPSVSKSEIYLSRGTIGISTSQFLTGSSMSCSTDLGSINIRGGNIRIESNPDETIIDLLDGS